MTVRTLILCEGKGIRADPNAIETPKPLLEVGGRPVLGHAMEIYARQGFTDFVLAAGFEADKIEQFAKTLPSEWSVDVRDTDTGGGLITCAPDMGETFFVAYANGLGNVDLHSLLEFHFGTPGVATVTVVPLPSQHRTIDSDATGRVVRFTEKPRLSDYWINAGFFVMDQRASQWFGGPDLERDILPALSQGGQLYSYEHLGFWKSTDTREDALELTALCERDNDAPWNFHPLIHQQTVP
jgi:glucose-1-phosphate cytidylyltransferase